MTMEKQRSGYFNLANSILGYQAQERYCEENKLPIFIDESCTCYLCGRHIFDSDGGYSISFAEKSLITGCPFCNVSFCD